MTYSVELRPSARRTLRDLLSRDAARIVHVIEGLSGNPRPPGAKKLVGLDHLFRVRVGDYRIVYQIQDDKLLVLVVRIGHRRDVYRN